MAQCGIHILLTLDDLRRLEDLSDWSWHHERLVILLKPVGIGDLYIVCDIHHFGDESLVLVVGLEY